MGNNAKGGAKKPRRFLLQTLTQIISFPAMDILFKPRVYYEGGKKVNRYKLIKGGALVASNHRYLMDAVFLLYLFRFRYQRQWVSEAVYKNGPPLTWMMDAVGFINLDRSKSDMDALQVAINEVDAGHLFCCFPEGRLGKGEELWPFRPGTCNVALRTGRPVLPIYIAPRYGLFTRSSVIFARDVLRPEDFRDEAEPLRAMTRALQDKVAALGQELKARGGDRSAAHASSSPVG